MSSCPPGRLAPADILPSLGNALRRLRPPLPRISEAPACLILGSPPRFSVLQKVEVVLVRQQLVDLVVPEVMPIIARLEALVSALDPSDLALDRYRREGPVLLERGRCMPLRILELSHDF